MDTARRRWIFAAGFCAAMALGWALGAAPGARLSAGGADRWNDRVVLTGPISLERDRQGPFYPVDALYVLNYSNGLLLAAVPSFESSPAGRKTFSDFAERDLVKDFGIEPGTNPHFLMTTVNSGVRADGWAPLVVIETETGQVATYRVQPQTVPGTNRPAFLLLDRRADPRLARAVAASAENPAR
jgi:hypothetical protein